MTASTSTTKSGVYAKVSTGTHPTGAAAPLDSSRSRPGRLRCLITMIASLSAGLALVIIQCVVYWCLSGKTVSSTIPQAWASRVGTALAFLVKLLFATAASSAYVQRQWLALSTTTWEISQIDSLTGVLGNILLFRHVKLWLRNPILLCLAVVTWLIPLAAVIAPGSLVVTSDRRQNSTIIGVPQLSYDWQAYGQYTYDPDHAASQLVAASTPLRRVAMTATTSSQITSMQPLFQNYTYEQQFYAPALRCFGANATLINNMTASLNINIAVEQYLQFLAFTPNYLLDLSGPANGTDWESSDLYSGMDEVSQDVYRLFVVPYSNITSSDLNNTIECNLQNASYTAQIAFQNGVQSIELPQVDLLHDVAPTNEVGINATSLTNVTSGESMRASYTNIMLAFSKILAGYSQESHYGGTTTSYSYFDMTSIDWSTRQSSEKGLEQLFRNITLSVLSVPDLTKNQTATEQLAVNVATFPLVYKFEPEDILIAYGLAFGFALSSVVMGILAVISQGGSYSNIFSTFVRVTRGEALEDALQRLDDGMDPLPASVAETRLRLGGGVKEKSSGMEMGRVALSSSTESSNREAGQTVRHSQTI